jgi:hypothetical protein
MIRFRVIRAFHYLMIIDIGMIRVYIFLKFTFGRIFNTGMIRVYIFFKFFTFRTIFILSSLVIIVVALLMVLRLGVRDRV